MDPALQLLIELHDIVFLRVIVSAKWEKMADIAATLGNMVDRPVLDETGLDAHYDV